MDDEEEEEEEEEGPTIGKPGRSQTKGENILNQPKRDREARERAQGQLAGIQQPQADIQQQPQAQGAGVTPTGMQRERDSKIPPFGDGSSDTYDDWTTTGLIDDPIDQFKDTCCSVVFTHLLQFMYNKGRPIAQRRKLSHMDLAEFIKGRNKGTKGDKYAFRNMNIPIKHIRNVGIHAGDKVGGHGGTTKGDFEHRSDVSKDFVYEQLRKTPVGIVLENKDGILSDIKMEIYDVPPTRTEIDEEHAMLLVARGTRIGANGQLEEFVVAQNSWGTRFSNAGYCRLFLPADGRFKIYWPVSAE